MRRVILAIGGTVTGLVLLLSFKTRSTDGAVATPPAAIGTPSATSSSGSGSSGGSSSASTTKTVTGDAVDTPFGPVQVQITVENGQLAAVTAIDYPTANPRDAQINSYAIPQLTQEALAAKSAEIDTISGATFTSEGYIASLQSALDRANG